MEASLQGAHEMQNTIKKIMGFTLAGLTLTGLSTIARPVSAQGTGAAPPAAGGGRNGGQGRGGAGFMARMPFAMGTITGGDATNRTIAIKSQMTGAVQTIQLSVATQIYTQVTVTVADLKINDKVKVSGIPTAITADSITAGDIPDFLQPTTRPRPGGAAPAIAAATDPTAQDDPNGDTVIPAPKVQATASATGKVISLSPLTVELSKDVSVVLKLAPKAKIIRITLLPFKNLNVGDKIVAAGQANTEGVFEATGIGINIDPSSGLGIGGFPGGGGGFGGGGRGGRGGRGGNAGGGAANGTATGN